jgi:lipopolysaccharide transport system ATP-binding protein
VRLAFAVAAHLDTDILLVDEVLSVGDAEFQKKSLGKMDDVANSGRTVIFVSHNVAAIEALCHQGIFFQGGRMMYSGPIAEALAEYHKAIRAAVSDGPVQPVKITNRRYFRSMDVVDETGESTRVIPMGTTLNIKMEMEFPDRFDQPVLFVFIDNTAGQKVLCVASPKSERAISTLSGPSELSCVIDQLPLQPGDYYVRLGLMRTGEYVEETERALMFTVRDADTFRDGWGAHGGACVANSRWRAVEMAPESIPTL